MYYQLKPCPLCPRKRTHNADMCWPCYTLYIDGQSRVFQNYIAVLRVNGACFKQIAGRLGINPKTVQWHWGRLCRRVGSTDVAAVFRWALGKGLVTVNHERET